MTARRPGWSKVEVVPLLVALVAGCRVDTEAFQNRLFVCDTGAKDPLCGTDRDGKAMTCFAARSIGGPFDFCAESCDGPPMSLPDEDAICVQGGAKLKACNPQDDTMTAAAPGPCGNPQLGCLRTNVIPSPDRPDEGVCVTGHPCLDDEDCGDIVKSTCAATFLQKLYAGAPAEKLHADHLYCLQQGCVQGRTLCSPGESCLPTYIPAAANPPDICVPNCDSHDRCPPNFFCYQKISGPANPRICIPGLLGFVCETDVDCMMGTCVSDEDPAGHGLHLCTTPCARDEDCDVYDSQQGRFVCSRDGRCITPEAYRGASCNDDGDCSRDVGTVCVWPPPGPSGNPGDLGTCLRPCAADRTCSPRGTIGHTCLPFYDENKAIAPVCFPGYFPYPCTETSECAVPELHCADPLNICTITCGMDEECATNRWTAGQSYCAGGYCVPLLDDDADCTRNSQCASGLCGVTGKCQHVGP